MAFKEKNGRPTCEHCGYELSAMVADNEVYDCECDKGQREKKAREQALALTCGDFYNAFGMYGTKR